MADAIKVPAFYGSGWNNTVSKSETITNTMDSLELIRTFREVAVRGSFSAAALQLDVSKANVSKYVAQLEERLGVRLLNRTTRSVSLTDAGSLLLQRSEPLLTMVALTRSEIEEHATNPRGHLRITAPYGLTRTALPDLVAQFMLRHPLVRISLDVNNRVVDLVDEGVDLALRVGPIEDSSLIARKLQPLTVVTCAAPSYWQSRGTPQHPDELTGHDALTYSPLGTHPQWGYRVQGKLHAVPVNSRMDASDGAPLIAAALRGLGMIRVPELLVQDLLADGSLQAVLGEFSSPDIWLYAAYAQRRHNSAALKAMLVFLEQNWRKDASAA